MNIKTAIERCEKSAFATRAKDTAETYGYGLKSFSQYLLGEDIKPGDPIETVSMDYFIYFPAFLAEREYSKQTMGVYVAAAKFFLDWLVINNVLAPNYQESLRFQKAIEQVFKRREAHLPRFPRRGDAEKIKEVVRQVNAETPILERDIAIVYFLYSSGCRNRETARMLVKDIDLTERTAKVTGKGNKERKVFFSEEAASAIREYWKARKYAEKSDPAFARHDRGAGKKHIAINMASIRNIVDEAVSLAGFEKGSFTPHYFRHAFAIKVLSETHDLAMVQDLMGHATPAATRVYAKIYPDELRDAHRRIYK